MCLYASVAGRFGGGDKGGGIFDSWAIFYSFVQALGSTIIHTYIPSPR